MEASSHPLPHVRQSTEFKVQGMDCSAEEQLIRLQLNSMPGVQGLQFDLPARKLVVVHSGDHAIIQRKLESLNLGPIQFIRKSGNQENLDTPVSGERGPLRAAFSINASLFLVELAAGLLAYSMGLVADSLDMLADAVVYGIALAAVGGSTLRKKSIARTMGYLQVFLACAGLAEVLRRFLFGEGVPDSRTMVVLSAIALLGNVATLLILNKNRNSEVHMKAAWLCTSVDVQVNALVIATGFFVHFVPSRIPDLVVGDIIFLLVANGARKILALAK
ncbi:MAG TPA: cation transporter [Fibrobacteria bacterium]|nr:cation transporter [Fibrobacteria bacterium]